MRRCEHARRCGGSGPTTTRSHHANRRDLPSHVWPATIAFDLAFDVDGPDTSPTIELSASAAADH